MKLFKRLIELLSKIAFIIKHGENAAVSYKKVGEEGSLVRDVLASVDGESNTAKLIKDKLLVPEDLLSTVGNLGYKTDISQEVFTRPIDSAIESRSMGYGPTPIKSTKAFDGSLVLKANDEAIQLPAGGRAMPARQFGKSEVNTETQKKNMRDLLEIETKLKGLREVNSYLFNFIHCDEETIKALIADQLEKYLLFIKATLTDSLAARRGIRLNLSPAAKTLFKEIDLLDEWRDYSDWVRREDNNFSPYLNNTPLSTKNGFDAGSMTYDEKEDDRLNHRERLQKAVKEFTTANPNFKGPIVVGNEGTERLSAVVNRGVVTSALLLPVTESSCSEEPAPDKSVSESPLTSISEGGDSDSSSSSD
jgi:hypothetical protein